MRVAVNEDCELPYSVYVHYLENIVKMYVRTHAFKILINTRFIYILYLTTSVTVTVAMWALNEEGPGLILDRTNLEK